MEIFFKNVRFFGLPFVECIKQNTEFRSQETESRKSEESGWRLSGNQESAFISVHLRLMI